MTFTLEDKDAEESSSKTGILDICLIKAFKQEDMESVLKWMEKLLFLLFLIYGCYGEHQDLSGKKFIIPVETSDSFVKLSGNVLKPVIAMTMCQRFFTDVQRDQSLFSLATPSDSKDINLCLQSKGGYKLNIRGNSVTITGLPENRNAWISFCGTWDSKTGLTQMWANGRRSASKILKPNGPINGKPSIILGQNQGSYGGGFVASQSFVGDVTDVHFWDSVISPCQIKLYMQGKNFTTGNILNWRALEFTTGGGVFKEMSDYNC
ncbi:C-reactive protein-like [Salvelinus namaycush]|uniref:C-reactive protein-like n=1 Tax=Salvelinus namaycush TaxID=8040 RepID=A0A8U0QQF3_SALNM|nr:C-reactive protein-like [Salvelinus namaycush]